MAFESAGFREARVTERFDCFAGTTKERTARKHHVVGVNFTAVKPA